MSSDSTTIDDVLIPKPLWAPIRDGVVTIVFRRWKRLQVKPDRVYRTAAGRLQVRSVTTVSVDEITDADARRSGAADAADAIAALRGDDTDPIYRIEFEYLDEPDPRTVLANDAALASDDLEDIERRLTRLDRASKSGPWTRQTLELIAAHPERRAPDLAEMVQRETQAFKLDVRKLKNLGLTTSFRIGYRLSPRGTAYLEHMHAVEDSVPGD